MAWDPRTGEPLHNAIVWQDRRTAARCDELRAAGREQLVRERTGLVLDPYFSGTKIEWLRREGGVPDGAVFGTVDSWLAYKLTGRHVTDYSNASRTLLFDIRRLDWDPELCELLGVDPASLPEPLPSAGVFGETSELGGSVPVAGIAGDQQAALYGQACHSPGLGKNTYGTGSFVLENAGRHGAAARGRPAHDRRLGRGGPCGLRARGGDLRDRRRGAVAARRARRDRRPRPTPRASPARSRATTACTWCPRSPASAHRTGTRTRAARSSGSRAAPARRTSPARRSSRSATRRWTPCGRWSRRRACGSRS